MTAPTMTLDPMDELADDANEFLIRRLSKEIKDDVRKLDSNRIRYLIDLYYQTQELRITSAHRARRSAMVDEETGEIEGNPVADHLLKQVGTVENQVKALLNEWAAQEPICQWAQEVVGIGPVLSAGLAAMIDITPQHSPSMLWSYAGLNPKMVWAKGQKRPYNARLKTLCYKIGESFVKVQNREGDFYGHMYRARREYEAAKNEAGDYAKQAEHILETRNFKGDTPVKAAYTAGKLPAAHLHARARRWTVKMFLSHYWEASHLLNFGERPAKPWIISVAGHKDYVEPPHLDLITEYLEMNGPLKAGKEVANP